jgi:S1-C subfamily serine protease
MKPASADEALHSAAAIQQALNGQAAETLLVKAMETLTALRDFREFSALCELAERVCPFIPHESPLAPTARKLLVQGLIETGRSSSAIGVAEAALACLDESASEHSELCGLLGRAYKQLFIDFPEAPPVTRQHFLRQSHRHYSVPFEQDRSKHVWHGINLAALRHAAGKAGMDTSNWQASDELAKEVLHQLEAMPRERRDHYWYATLAEAHAALGQWDQAREALALYAEQASSTAFSFASTLRQLRELWSLGEHTEGLQLLQHFESLLLRSWRPDAVKALTLQTSHLRQLHTLAPAQLEKHTGIEGTETIDWYRTGLTCAGSVAAIEEHLGVRFGTGFAVRAGDLQVPGVDADEILLLTNHHVLNSSGAGPSLSLRQVRAKFEALPQGVMTFEIDRVLFESPHLQGLDYALVKLKGKTSELPALAIAASHDAVRKQQRIFVIGCPLGQTLQISLHGGSLVDHECPPTGLPPMPNRRRLHYTAATAKGNSGSPVFNDRWECIALHHAGGKMDLANNQPGLSRLNGHKSMTRDGENQGIWLGSIIEDLNSSPTQENDTCKR